MYLRQAGTVVSACVRFSLGFLLYNRSIKDNPYSTSSRKNSFEVSVSFGFQTVITSIRDDPYWTSRENSFEPIEVSTINKVSLV
jgi:hypothetical protein